MEAVEFDQMLVPLDASEEALSAVEYAISVAERYDADVHVLYVLSENVARGIDAGDLDGSYPDPPTVADYERYLEAYRATAERCECSVWDLYRALWVLGRNDG